MKYLCIIYLFFFFFKQKTAYEMRISDWSSDVCSSDLVQCARTDDQGGRGQRDRAVHADGLRGQWSRRQGRHLPDLGGHERHRPGQWRHLLLRRPAARHRWHVDPARPDPVGRPGRRRGGADRASTHHPGIRLRRLSPASRQTSPTQTRTTPCFAHSSPASPASAPTRPCSTSPATTSPTPTDRKSTRLNSSH